MHYWQPVDQMRVRRLKFERGYPANRIRKFRPDDPRTDEEVYADCMMFAYIINLKYWKEGCYDERLEMPLTDVLRNATIEQRENYILEDDGATVYWPDLNERMSGTQIIECYNVWADYHTLVFTQAEVDALDEMRRNPQPPTQKALDMMRQYREDIASGRLIINDGR